MLDGVGREDRGEPCRVWVWLPLSERPLGLGNALSSGQNIKNAMAMIITATITEPII